MRACPKCGQRYPDGTQYCPTDGNALGPALASADAAGGADPRIGTLIDRYRILEVLGTGGMGADYRAQHTMIGRAVALKLLHPDLARDPSVVDRFFREARAANEIQNDHIVARSRRAPALDGRTQGRSVRAQRKPRSTSEIERT
jgi:eukaryotic-like serine/threonine-protein kinase